MGIRGDWLNNLPAPLCHPDMLFYDQMQYMRPGVYYIMILWMRVRHIPCCCHGQYSVGDIGAVMRGSEQIFRNRYHLHHSAGKNFHGDTIPEYNHIYQNFL